MNFAEDALHVRLILRCKGLRCGVSRSWKIQNLGRGFSADFYVPGIWHEPSVLIARCSSD